jgi:hypothetical protein
MISLPLNATTQKQQKLPAEYSLNNITKNEGRSRGRVSTESGETRFLALKRLQPNCAGYQHI